MALILIVIIMIIGLGIVGGLYASINPFVYKLGNATNYNSAYYAAVMSVERWMLALRYHDAWFQWSSSLSTGNLSDSLISHDFWRIKSSSDAALSRAITSRSVWIPATWQWNIEALFSTWDSEDYNSLWYYEGLELPLFIDTTSATTEYYETPPPGNFVPIASTWDVNIVGNFRLPPKIQAWLSNQPLDDTADVDTDTIWDDIIVNRWFKWYDTLWLDDFTIIPTIRQDFGLGIPLYPFDSAIRESIINQWSISDNINTTPVGANVLWFHFAIPWNGDNSVLAEHNILPLSAPQRYTGFEELINDNSIIDKTLNFNITNRMRTADGNIYPFLEWRLQACDSISGLCDITMPDRFYNLQWVWTIGWYTVRINIKKPVRETSNASNFTIIF